MELTCSCDAYGGETFYDDPPTDFVKYPFKRGRKCRCGEMIKTGNDCVEFKLFREANAFEVNMGIKTEEDWIPIASSFSCEKCGGVALSAMAQNYCVYAGDDFTKITKGKVYQNYPKK